MDLLPERLGGPYHGTRPQLRPPFQDAAHSTRIFDIAETRHLPWGYPSPEVCRATSSRSGSGTVGCFLEGQGTTMSFRCAMAAVVGETPRETNHLPDSVRRANLGLPRLLLPCVSAAFLFTAAVASFADDKKDSAKPPEPDTVVCLELPHPERVIDRLTDPRLQKYLMLSQQYQKFSSGKQLGELRAVAGVVASQLNTTWEEGLRDLTGGGILAEVEAAPGQAPRIHVLITAKKPDLLEKTSEVFLKLARQDAQQKGKPDPASTSSHRGLSITAIGGAQGIAYCIADGRLLASNSVKNLERLIDRGVELAALSGKPPAAGKADGALAALGTSPRWKAIREKQGPDSLAWSFVDLDRLRKIDPAKFSYKERPDTGITILFGSWYEALRTAHAATASIRWSDSELAANVDLPQPKRGASAGLQGLCTGLRQGGRAAHPAAGHNRLTEPVARLVGNLGVESRPVLARDRTGFRPARHIRRPVLRRS